MRFVKCSIAMLIFPFALCGAQASGDNRELVKLPEMMQDHMLRNMRDMQRCPR